MIARTLFKDQEHHLKRFTHHDLALDELDKNDNPYTFSAVAKGLYHGFWYYYHDIMM